MGGWGQRGTAAVETCHTTIPWSFPRCTPHVRRFRFSTTSNPLRVTEAKSLPLDGFSKTCLPGAMGVAFSSHLLLPSCENAARKFPPPSLVSTLLRPSLCGWLLISSKGSGLRSLLQKTHDLISHYHQVSPNGKEKNRCPTVRSWPCSPPGHHIHLCKVTWDHDDMRPSKAAA